MVPRNYLTRVFLTLVCLTVGSAICLTRAPCSVAAQNSAAVASFASLEGHLDIAGGTAHIPVMHAAAKNIRQANPRILVSVSGGGSGVGVQKLRAGLVQIGNTGRALSAAEQADLVSHAFAIDGIAIIVHPDLPMSELSAETARKIFAGELTRWEQLPTGTKKGPIHLYVRDEASGTRETFSDRLMKQSMHPAAAHVVASNGAMKGALSRDTLGIGYLSIGYVDPSVKAMVLDGIKPTQDETIAGRYPIARKLYMNVRADDKTALTQSFVAYILSPEMSPAIRESGYIPL